MFLTFLVNVFCSAVPRVLQLWKDSLVAAKREKTAQALADPLEYEDMFPDLQYGLLAEQAVKAARETPVPATSYYAWKESLDRDIISGTSFKLILETCVGLFFFSGERVQLIFIFLTFPLFYYRVQIGPRPPKSA